MIFRFSDPPPNNFRQLLHFFVGRRIFLTKIPRTKYFFFPKHWFYFYFCRSPTLSSPPIFFFFFFFFFFFYYFLKMHCRRTLFWIKNSGWFLGCFPGNFSEILCQLNIIEDFKITNTTTNRLRLDKLSTDIVELDGSLMDHDTNSF